MPRRRPVVVESVAPRSGDVPPEILVGAVVGVWGADLLDAHRGYVAGRRQWEAETGLSVAEGVALAPAPRSPVDGEDAAARLARHGLDLDDVPALRRAARERLRH